ncbi:MAG: response regulator transcription factor [Spirochaetales bacterium]|nr:MAG: response regulator transcription factor [Spirochaetales bacterium]
MGGKNSILLIEDDKEIADIIAMHIADMGMSADIVRDGRQGLEKAQTAEFSLIILDIMLPGLDGLSVCKKIREKNPYVPILMLTAKSEEIDRVLGLEIGADDYMTKPFSVRELAARIKALLRRARTGKTALTETTQKGVVRFKEFILDPEKRKVTFKGKTLELTVKEFELLDLFMRSPGRTYSRNSLLQLIWGYQYEGYEHTVNSHINRLRVKIEQDPGNPKYLKTVWGVGYRFAELEELPDE